MKIYVILNTDGLSRPIQFSGITMSKKLAQEYKNHFYTVKEYSLFTLIRELQKLHW